MIQEPRKEWMLQEGAATARVKAELAYILRRLEVQGYTLETTGIGTNQEISVVSRQGTKLVEFMITSWGPGMEDYRLSTRILDLPRLLALGANYDASYVIKTVEKHMEDVLVTIPEAVRVLKAKQQATDGQAEPPADSGAVSEEEKPWKKIPDHNWDRQALELWWTGCTHREIGEKVRVTGHTVQNRMTDLRNTYGIEIVPTKKQLQEMWRTRNSG
jgi:hypothetical protein